MPQQEKDARPVFLEQRERYLASFVEAIRDGVLVFDARTRALRHANTAAAALLAFESPAAFARGTSSVVFLDEHLQPLLPTEYPSVIAHRERRPVVRIVGYRLPDQSIRGCARTRRPCRGSRIAPM